MTSRDLRTLAVALLIFPTSSHAQDPKGGFFDKGFTTKGWFASSAAPTTKEPGIQVDRYAPVGAQSSTAPSTISAASHSSAATVGGDNWTLSPEEAQALRDAGLGQQPAQTPAPGLPQTTPAQNPQDAMRRVNEVMERLRALQANQGTQSVPPQTPPASSNEPPSIASVNRPTRNPFDQPVAVNARVSLYVSTTNQGALLRTIKAAALLKLQRKVPIEEIILIGPIKPDLLTLDLVPPPNPAEGLRKLRQQVKTGKSSYRTPTDALEAVGYRLSPLLGALYDSGFSNVDSLRIDEDAKRLSLQSSPTWVVHGPNAVDYVYSGVSDIAQSFGEDGRYLGESHGVVGATRREGKVSADGSIVTFSEPGDVPLEVGSFATDVMAFRSPEQFFSISMVNYPELPNCTAPRDVATPIQQAPRELPSDIVFYSATDPQQVRAAQSFTGKSVAYRSGQQARQRGYSETAELLSLTQLIDIQCLPTRFRIVTAKNGDVSMEWHEGDSAWKKD